MSESRIGWWVAPAIALFTVLFAAHSAVHVGVHYDYALREGVLATATIVSVMQPKGKAGAFQDAEAHLTYVRAPDLDTKVAFVPVSDEFQARYQHLQGSTVSIHVPASPYLRPIIDEDPPWYPWLWPIVVLFCGFAFAALAYMVRNPPPPAPPLP